MITYLLDTGIVIRHLRGKRVIVRLLRSLGRRDRLAISAITRAEVRAGMRLHEQQATRHLLTRLETLPVDAAIADRAGDLVQRAHRQQRTLHLVDALIAATSAHRGLTLVTLNASDLSGLGLSLFPLPDDLS